MFPGYTDLKALAANMTRTFLGEYELNPEEKSAFFFFYGEGNKRFAAISGQMLPRVFYVVFAHEEIPLFEMRDLLWQIAEFLNEKVELCHRMVVNIERGDWVREQIMNLCEFRQVGTISGGAPSGKDLLMYEEVYAA